MHHTRHVSASRSTSVEQGAAQGVEDGGLGCVGVWGGGGRIREARNKEVGSKAAPRVGPKPPDLLRVRGQHRVRPAACHNGDALVCQRLDGARRLLVVSVARTQLARTVPSKRVEAVGRRGVGLGSACLRRTERRALAVLAEHSARWAVPQEPPRPRAERAETTLCAAFWYTKRQRLTNGVVVRRCRTSRPSWGGTGGL
jgi:hypothetical protein